jgi:hypothetical protein
MKVKNFFSISRNVASIFACLTIMTALSGCDPKDATPNPITVTDSKQLEQTVYADMTSGASAVNITTTGTWSSTITQKAQTRDAAPAPDWISISPDRGDKAGTYSIAITLSPNYSGAERAALITVFCMGTEVVITVTQRATKEDGTEHERFNRTITGHIVDADNSASTVKLKTESENVVVELATAPCQNGNFTITLPKTVESGLLYAITDNVPPAVQLSDRETRTLDVFWTLGNDDIVLISGDEKVAATLIYVDRDCNVTGYGMDESIRMEFNMELKAGWNWAYVSEKNGNISVTTTKPDVELQWLVEVQTPEPEPFNPVISGHIVNGSNVTDVQFVVDPELQEGITVLAADTCINGNFTIILPDTVDSRLLYLEQNMPNTMQSSESSFYTMLDWPLFISNAGSIHLRSADGKIEARLQYSNKDVVITGYVEEDNGKYRLDYDTDMKAGWNWIYIIEKSATHEIFSTTKPGVELRWELEPSTRRSKNARRELRIKN